MSMMAFSQRDSRRHRDTPDSLEVRREIINRRTTGGVHQALSGVLHGSDPSEAAAAMHEALTATGYETSLETVEAALRELSTVLRTPAPTPAPDEPHEGQTPGQDLDPEMDPSEDSEELEDAPPDPLATLYHLVDHDVRLEVRDGKLYAGRPAGLTPRLREQLGEHKEALIGLLSEEAVAAALTETTRYVSDALRGRGEAAGSHDETRARRCLTMAQNAYSRREFALCRYRLQSAEMAAAGRRADDAPPAPRPASSGTTPEQRAKTSEPTDDSERLEVPKPSALVEGDDLEPGRDHQVFLDRKAKVILLSSSYPTEIALQGAKQAYQRANPGSRVEVRRSLRYRKALIGAGETRFSGSAS